MVWVRLADDFTDHPKVVAAGPLASWLYVCGLTYANRYLTDGFIPSGQVRRMADVDDSQALAQRLVDNNLWEPVEGGYLIHDYHGYQPSSDDVKREREQGAKRQADYQARKREERAYNGANNAVSNGDSTHAPYPDPARTRNPVPEPVRTRPPDALELDGIGGAGGEHGADAPPKPKRGGKAPRTLAPNVLEPTDADYEAGDALGMTPDLVEQHAAAMLDHWRSKGELRADWHASLRTWLRNSQKFDQPRGGSGYRNGSPRPPPNGQSALQSRDASKYFETRGGTIPRR